LNSRAVASAWSSDNEAAPNGAQQAAAVVVGPAVVAVAIQPPLVSMNVDATVPHCIDICQSIMSTAVRQ
jgi:hypothetical protein